MRALVLSVAAWCLLACGAGGDERLAPEVRTVSYGPAPQQIGTLSIPAGADAAEPPTTVVLIHGGFWRERYGADLMKPLAADLVDRGFAAWNVEYRRIGHEGGGYPGTLDDIAAAVDHLAVLADEEVPIDLERLAVVGHSAGGHLSLWVGTREDPVVVPSMVVGLAPVADLVAAAEASLGADAVLEFMGAGPAAAPAEYAAASPAERLDRASIPQLVVQGAVDRIVPADVVADYVDRAATAGVEVEYEVFAETDHFGVIDPEDRSWQVVIDRLDDLDPG